MPAFGREIRVGIEQDLQEVTLQRGDFLEISLPGNRTTGYLWERVGAKGKSHLRLIRQEAIQSPSHGDEPLMGAPGGDRFLFEAQEVGRETLSFSYHRPWEKGPPPRSFVIHARIKGGSTH